MASFSDHSGGGTGTLYAFVPAHGHANAGLVARQVSRSMSNTLHRPVLFADFTTRGYPLLPSPQAPHRLDGRTWGAFVSEENGVSLLDLSESHPRDLHRLLDFARSRGEVICADLTSAREGHSLELLRSSEAIFIVSEATAQSLESAREKADWMRSIDLGDRTALLLSRVEGGLEPAEAETITGLPVCGLIETAGQLTKLAEWLISTAS